MQENIPRVLRVLALASKSGKYGGPFDTACRQAELAIREGIPVTVVAGALRGDEPEPRANLQTRVARKMTKRSFVMTHSASLAILIVRATKAADVVHVSFSREAIPMSTALVARLFRKRLILQPHGMLTSRTSRAHRIIDYLATKSLIGANTTLVALTSSEATALGEWCPPARDRIVIMGNPAPVGLAPLDDNRADSKTALFAARLHPRKRVQDFASAAVISADRHWRGHFTVIGPDEGDLPVLQKSIQATRNLHYLGATSSEGVLQHLQTAGVFVLPSANEPWGNVLVSALKLGVPVVVTKSAVLSALVRQYGAGCVVNDEAPEEIAAAVHHILDPATLPEFRRRARTLGEECFSEVAARESLFRLYTSSPRSEVRK